MLRALKGEGGAPAAMPPLAGWTRDDRTNTKRRVAFTLLPWADPKALSEMVRQGADRYLLPANGLMLVESKSETFFCIK